MIARCSRNARADTLHSSPSAMGGTSSGGAPSTATACSVSVTPSCTRMDPRRAPTVSEISLRIVAAVSSSETVRPRISVIVYSRLISSYRSASSLAACSTSMEEWRYWETTGRRNPAQRSGEARASEEGPRTSHARRRPGMLATSTGPPGDSTMAGGPLSSGGVHPMMPTAGTEVATRVGRCPSSPSQTAALHPVASRKLLRIVGSSIMPVQRHAYDVPVIREAFDAVHEARHEKEAPPILAHEVLRTGRILHAGEQVEARPLIHDFENDALAVDVTANPHAALRHVGVPAEDGIRQRFG